MTTHLDLCTFPACSKPVRAKGLCMGHYTQQRQGRPLSPLRAHKPKGTSCGFPLCPLPYWGNGLCRQHNRNSVAPGVPADAPFKIQQQSAGRWFSVAYGTDRMNAHHVLNVFRAKSPATAYRLIVGYPTAAP